MRWTAFWDGKRFKNSLKSSSIREQSCLILLRFVGAYKKSQNYSEYLENTLEKAGKIFLQA